jgi:hypothetical protein
MSPNRREMLKADVQSALGQTSISSATQALVFLAGLGSLAGLIGGGFALLGQFTGRLFGALALFTVAATLLAFLFLELARFRRQSRLLRELLYEDVDYVALLAEARRERDEARTSAAASEMRLMVFLGAREVVGELVETPDRTPARVRSARQLTPPEGDNG